jgi:hypothetical protein
LERDLNETNNSKKRPISVVLVEKDAGEVDMLAVVFDYHNIARILLDQETEATHKFGFDYYKFNVATDEEDIVEVLSWETFAPHAKKIGYGMLLPLLDSRMDQSTRLFALIACNWKILGPKVSLHELVDEASSSSPSHS